MKIKEIDSCFIETCEVYLTLHMKSNFDNTKLKTKIGL